MDLTLEELTRINKVQIEILRETVAVCEKLNIPFFMVHGSLLGTIRNQGFIPYDDDIDIAIPREHYEVFLSKAQSMIGDNYFVQSSMSDKNYPLDFAKVRDSRTTYIVENVRNIDMNHGIYIDIFPIDFAFKDRFSTFLYKLYNLRIGRVYKTKSIALMIKRMLACVLCPSFTKTVVRRNALLKSLPKSDSVRMTGGKAVETCMPAEWFEQGEQRSFEGIEVYIPIEYDKYLTHIYGDYTKRTLVEDKMADENRVCLNACIADVEKPFAYYVDFNK